MKLFDAFKQYIVKHPKVAAYKPTSADYDRDKLFAIVKKLAEKRIKALSCKEDESERRTYYVGIRAG